MHRYVWTLEQAEDSGITAESVAAVWSYTGGPEVHCLLVAKAIMKEGPSQSFCLIRECISG